jgi:hypothetical protein
MYCKIKYSRPCARHKSTWRGMDVQIHSFLTSVPGGGDCMNFASRPSYPTRTASYNQWMGEGFFTPLFHQLHSLPTHTITAVLVWQPLRSLAHLQLISFLPSTFQSLVQSVISQVTISDITNIMLAI